MGSSTKGSQSQTTTTTPDPTTEAWRQTIFNRGNTLLNQGPPAYYPGSTVAPFSPQTQSGLQQLENYAGGPAPNLQNANDAAARALSGFNPATGAAAATAYGAGDTAGRLSPMLSTFLSGSNPFLEQMFASGAGKVTDSVNSQFAKAGRYGPNASYGAGLSKGLGDLYTGIYAPAYETNMNRALAATQTLGDTMAADENRRLSGASTLGSIYSQGNADASQATNNLSSIYSYGTAPAALTQGVGSIYDQQNQELTDADVNRYNYTQNAPWQYLQQFADMMNGLPTFGTQSSTGTSKTKSGGLSFGFGPNGFSFGFG